MVFLQFLFENMAEVNWSKVPYGSAVRRYLEAVKVIQDESPLVLQARNTSEKKVTKVMLNEGHTEAAGNQPSKGSKKKEAEKKDEKQIVSTLENYLPIPPKLMSRLLRLQKVYDFSKVVLNKEVNQLKAGTQFGEVALNNDEKRMASVKAIDRCILAYLEREEYQKQLKKASVRDTQNKMYFLKENQLFQDLSIVKLQKMSYYMKQLTLIKNQKLYS